MEASMVDVNKLASQSKEDVLEDRDQVDEIGLTTSGNQIKSGNSEIQNPMKLDIGKMKDGSPYNRGDDSSVATNSNQKSKTRVVDRNKGINSISKSPGGEGVGSLGDS